MRSKWQEVLPRIKKSSLMIKENGLRHEKAARTQINHPNVPLMFNSRISQLLSLAAGNLAEAKSQPAPFLTAVTPKVVWNHDRVDCEFGDTACLIGAMKTGGASNEAIRFAEWLAARDDAGWADDFKELGPVDLVSTFQPFRANTNYSYFLVNGSPNVVEVTWYELTAADRARSDLQRVFRRDPEVFLIFKLSFVRRDSER